MTTENGVRRRIRLDNPKLAGMSDDEYAAYKERQLFWRRRVPVWRVASYMGAGLTWVNPDPEPLSDQDFEHMVEALEVPD